MVNNTASQSEALGMRRLARAYVPFQKYGKRFRPEEGLSKGTVFPELYMPYGSREKTDRG
jgi:hypothetical protein